jgi:hypothetical protein
MPAGLFVALPPLSLLAPAVPGAPPVTPGVSSGVLSEQAEASIPTSKAQQGLTRGMPY